MAESSIRVGNVEIVCVTDVVAAMPLEATFPAVPADEWSEFQSRYPDAFDGPSNVKVHMGAYWVQCAEGPVVVDTGLGPRPVEMVGGLKGALPEAMEAHGLQPAEAAMVFHTHAHIDHVGWSAAEGQLTFPNARYVLHRADWDAFHNPDVLQHFPPYVEEALDPLEAAGVLDLIDGEQSLTSELTAFPTPGHTPGHMSVLVSSAGEQAIITGDVLVTPAQITRPEWASAFDMDPEAATQTRTALLDRLEAEGLRVITCHFPAPGAGTIVRVEGRRYFQGVDLA